MTTKRRRRHTPEQIVRKLRDADAMLNAGKEEAAVLQALEVSQATYDRWRKQYGGMKAEEARRLKELEEENKRLKEIVAEKELDIRMLKHLQQGNCRAGWPAIERGPLPESVWPCSNFKRPSRSRNAGRAKWWINRGARSVTSHNLGTTSPVSPGGCCS